MSCLMSWVMSWAKRPGQKGDHDICDMYDVCLQRKCQNPPIRSDIGQIGGCGEENAEIMSYMSLMSWRGPIGGG